MSIWIASSHPASRLLRLDRDGRVERELPAPSGLVIRSLLARSGALWCLAEDGELVKLDAASGAVLGRRRESSAAALAAGGEVLWAIADWTDDWYELEREADEPERTVTNTRIARINLTSLELEWVDLGVVPRAISATEHAAWVVAEHAHGKVVRVDAQTLDVTNVLSRDAGVHGVLSAPQSGGVIAASSSTKLRDDHLALDAMLLHIDCRNVVRVEHLDFGEHETRSLTNPFTQVEVVGPASGAAQLAVGAMVDGRLWLGGSDGIYRVTEARALRVLEFEEWAARADGSHPPRFTARYFTSTDTEVWAFDPQAEVLWRIDHAGTRQTRRDLTITALGSADT